MLSRRRRRSLSASRNKPDFHAIAERLTGELPDAELALIQGAGDLPSLEQPEATAALVSGFLTR